MSNLIGLCKRYSGIENILSFPSLSWGTNKQLKLSGFALIYDKYIKRVGHYVNGGAAMTVKVCLYHQICWEKPTFSEFQIIKFNISEKFLTYLSTECSKVRDSDYLLACVIIFKFLETNLNLVIFFDQISKKKSCRSSTLLYTLNVLVICLIYCRNFK